MTPTSRDQVLARIRSALRDVPGTETPDSPPIARDYLHAHVAGTPEQLVDLLAENLADYRAHVRRCTETDLPDVIGRLLAEHGSRSVAVPDGLPAAWLSGIGEVTEVYDSPDLTAARLDEVDSVLTGSALAIAETGTVVLNGGPGQGRRILTLVPDHHVCIVRVPGQVVASLPVAMSRLDPSMPATWISGPSATSDIELDRVEGVHGPRRLDVVLVTESL